MTVKKYRSLPTLHGGVEALKLFLINFASCSINFRRDPRLLSFVACCAAESTETEARISYIVGTLKYGRSYQAKMPGLFEKPDRPLSRCCLFIPNLSSQERPA